MPKLKRLSGSEVVRIFQQFGFHVLTQKGSHIKLRRINAAGGKETLTIPNHREVDTGTCHAIFRQGARYILVEELRPHFYFD
jgi:predicted RNA binding protein YcfA (HicA-like mRNA interferase family)